jgi:hypothetical protein
MNEKIRRIPTFVSLSPGERPVREYYVACTDRRRFPPRVWLIILVLALFYLLPGIVAALYFALRRLDIRHAQVMLTDLRLVYFEYGDHPATNLFYVQDVSINEISSIAASGRHSFLTRSFALRVWTRTRAALSVGGTVARNFLGKALDAGGPHGHLEPAGDYLKFIQEVGAAVTELQLEIRQPA